MTLPTPTPNPWLPEDAYRVPRHPAPVALNLDGNEGIGPESLRRYPSPAPLEARLAERFGLSPDRVLVTAGGDEGSAVIRVRAGTHEAACVVTVTNEAPPEPPPPEGLQFSHDRYNLRLAPIPLM